MKTGNVSAAVVGGLVLAASFITPAFAQLTGGNVLPTDNNLIIQKVDADTGRVIEAYPAGPGIIVKHGAQFAGESCTRGLGDVDYSCENLRDYSWFRDDIPEYGTTGMHFAAEIPMVSSVNEDNTPTKGVNNSLMVVTVGEAEAPTGYDKIDGVARIYLSGNQWQADPKDLPKGVTLTRSNGYVYLNFNDHKTPQPTAKHYTLDATYQVDSYNPTNKAQRGIVAKLDDDGKLMYREDRALWGHSAWQFVHVKLDQTRPIVWSDIVKAINTQTTSKVGDINTSQKMNTVGSHVTVAWQLTNGATPANGWGGNHKSAQLFVGRGW